MSRNTKFQILMQLPCLRNIAYILSVLLIKLDCFYMIYLGLFLQKTALRISGLLLACINCVYSTNLAYMNYSTNEILSLVIYYSAIFTCKVLSFSKEIWTLKKSTHTFVYTSDRALKPTMNSIVTSLHNNNKYVL